MGRYQYELSNCIETCCNYNIPNDSCYTFVNAWASDDYVTFRLADVSCTGSDWNTATGFIQWALEYSGGTYLSPYSYSCIKRNCFGKDRLIVNNFPTDRIVIVGMYGFQWTDYVYSSSDCCSRLKSVAQRQMFILPSGQGACFRTSCAIDNLGYRPNGCCIFPNDSGCDVCALPYFLSIESYPLPVLNSNGFIGNGGCNTWVKPTSICSTGSLSGDSHTIPIYRNNQDIACNLSSFVEPYSSCFSPSIKGYAHSQWSLGGKLSSDSSSSARDAYVLVSACGSWRGECGVPDNVTMVIANNTFPTGSCIWYHPSQTPNFNKLGYVMGLIENCNCWNGCLSCPMYGPPNAACANRSNRYCVPNIYESSRIQLEVPPASNKLTAHMTDHIDIQSSDPLYGCTCAYSSVCFKWGAHYVCNPLGYWTLNWSNGNSYYAVNTHC